ncbi:guanine nucleotide exchange factor [Chlamydoabsidia padenii]|nr:guanine nucleotide exchange factor [Chlamydoabsidia padenii]
MTNLNVCSTLDSGNQNDIVNLLKTIAKNPEGVALTEKPKFMDSLLTHLVNKTWNEQTLTLGLETLKLLGRTTQGSEVLFSEKGTQALVKISGLDDIDSFQDTPPTHEALKCMANCILLDEKTKTYLENNNGIRACGKLLQSRPVLSIQVQFLICRILFFMTVNRSDIVKELMNYDIAQSTEKILMENVQRIKQDKTIDMAAPINPVSVVNEALKMLFNMILAYGRQQQQEGSTDTTTTPITAPDYFRQCLIPILDIIFLIPPPQPLPISPPHSHAIHALMQYPCSVIVDIWREHKNDIFQSPDLTVEQGRAFVAKKMTELLQDSLMYLIPDEDPDEQAPPDRQHYNIDAILSPIILVIRNLAHGDPNLRPLIANNLLPQQSDRMMPVNQGKGLPAYLIRLMTSAMLPQTRDAVCETMFVLCDEDATRFTQKVGYGNAIGFLVNKGIAMEPPQETQQDDNNGDTDNDNQQINPITGQYVSAERDQGPALADMTDEEKEREAEKLFVLFERLKKTGIIDVENPIAKAMREGGGDSRITELDSDEE